MNAYRDRVEQLARLRDGKPIFNGSHDHAAIIVEKMFEHAKSRVDIFTGELYARVYGRDEVVEQARLFLADPRHKLRILVEDTDAMALGHPLLDYVWGVMDNVEVRQSTGATTGFHFLVMDEDSYRFQKDKTTGEAIAAFGDPKGTEPMRNIFDFMWDIGRPIPAPVMKPHLQKVAG